MGCKAGIVKIRPFILAIIDFQFYTFTAISSQQEAVTAANIFRNAKLTLGIMFCFCLCFFLFLIDTSRHDGKHAKKTEIKATRQEKNIKFVRQKKKIFFIKEIGFLGLIC